MQSRLIIKNFGPIKNIDLDLRNVNVFIGPQASGKSTIAKLFTICKTPLSFLQHKSYFKRFGPQSENDYEKFMEVLEEYNIQNFIEDDTYIKYDSETHELVIDKKSIKLTNKLEFDLQILENGNYDLLEYINKFSKKNNLFKNIFPYLIGKELGIDVDNASNEDEIISKILSLPEKDETKRQIITNELKLASQYCHELLMVQTLYVPAERIIVSILKDNALNLQKNNVKIPRHILNFAAEYEKALNTIHELDLALINKNVKFSNNDGVDRIFFSKSKSVLLSEASTGIQTIMPLLLSINKGYFKDNRSYSNLSFVIEEPESNLYPQTQYKLIKYLESMRRDSDTIDRTTVHTYTTHSPYILASFNNMLYAYKKNLQTLTKEQRKNLFSILPIENLVNPDSFSAYSIQDGKATSIFDRKEGLIIDNLIDNASEELNNDFIALMEI